MSTTFAKWNPAVSGVKTGTRDARILICGDSTSAGFGGSTGGYKTGYPAFLAVLLANAGLPSYNLAPAPPFGGIVNAEWTPGANWTAGNFYGFDSVLYHTSPGADSITYASPVLSDTYDIYYLVGPSAGDISVQATGGASALIHTSATAGDVGMTTIQAGSASASNVVTFTHTAGGAVFVVAAVSRLSTARKALVCNFGVGGSTTADWNKGPNFYSPNAIARFAPDLMLIMHGINDANQGISPDATVANLTALISAAQVTADVVLMSVIPSQSGVGSIYTNEQAMYPRYAPLAASQACAYADVWTAFGGAFVAGLMSDSLHPNDAGYQLVAQTVFAVLPSLAPAVAQPVEVVVNTPHTGGFSF